MASPSSSAYSRFMRAIPRTLRLPLFALPLTVLAFGCDERAGSPEPPPYLFDPRVALEPQLEKLKSAGDDPTKILRPASGAELAKLLEPGKRYDYVVLPNGALAIAPKSVEAPNNFWSTPVLANGGAVRTSGRIRIERSGDNLAKVIVDADDDAYCPTNESLRSALAALLALKVPSDVLRVDNRPADCFRPREAPKSAASAAASGAAPSFGMVMLTVARRFEVLGRAHKSKRPELARYQLEEIEETFHDQVPKTPLPPLPAGVTIAPYLEAMTKTSIPTLKKAIDAGDAKAIENAYAAMSKTCNGCHQAAGRPFIEIPSAPGEGVPKLEAK